MKIRLVKPSIRRKKQTKETPSRITNDTVAEHRERVLAGGRRYKYPMQYSRHKLVINATAIVVITTAVLVLFGWWQLYIVQNSNTFFYRVTRVLSLPVASVGNTSVRFSDYLLNYRTSEYYLSKYDEIRIDSDDGKLQLQYKKREALDIAIADAYARQTAKDQNLTVTDEEIESVLAGLRNAANGQITEETSSASSQRVLGLSGDDLKILVRNSILRSKAAFALDDPARKTSGLAKLTIEKGEKNLEKLAALLNKSRPDSAQYGVSGLVNISTTFGGIQAAEVAKQKKDAIVGPLKSVSDEGYYYVQLLESTDVQVSFAYLHIPLTVFDERLASFSEDGKIDEYITVEINQD